MSLFVSLITQNVTIIHSIQSILFPHILLFRAFTDTSLFIPSTCLCLSRCQHITLPIFSHSLALSWIGSFLTVSLVPCATLLPDQTLLFERRKHFIYLKVNCCFYSFFSFLSHPNNVYCTEVTRRHTKSLVSLI